MKEDRHFQNPFHGAPEGFEDERHKGHFILGAECGIRIMKPEQSFLTPGRAKVGPGDVQTLDEKYEDLETEDGTMSARNQAIAYREIMDIKAAANYLGVSRSHLSHILAGKVPRVPVIPHVRAGRRALIRRAVIDRWLLEQENDAATSIAQ